MVINNILLNSIVKFHHPHTSASPVTAHGYAGHGMPGLPSCSVQLPFIHQLLQVFCMLLQEVSELSPDWPNICLKNTNPHRFLELKRASILQNNTRPQQFPRFPPCFPMVFPNWNPGSAEPWRDGTPVHLAMISTGPFIDDLPMKIVIFNGKLSNYRGGSLSNSKKHLRYSQ